MLLGSNESRKKPTRRSSDATLHSKGLAGEKKKERSNSECKFTDLNSEHDITSVPKSKEDKKTADGDQLAEEEVVEEGKEDQIVLSEDQVVSVKPLMTELRFLQHQAKE